MPAVLRTNQRAAFAAFDRANLRIHDDSTRVVTRLPAHRQSHRSTCANTAAARIAAATATTLPAFVPATQDCCSMVGVRTPARHA
ncbi:hypothetical protein Bamb_1616 [Burkholderia ambifaria AMMD]|uniref:Uncharacterized protein n=1 Tax=Burkholderia ambifaria (strain ATCC BAA-244 / DSM 16087 / CCUG 44356 / LMG 19182 / AMMD) TaxID=339670 RepID=Q0BF99_BURCM|nr:hypothetical protein Bamb_1616 [Burkholderia ambifaria AMMD]